MTYTKDIIKNNNIAIVLVTHSSYIDICELFLKLFQLNWEKCPFEIILSISGEQKTIDGYKHIYNGDKASLPDCLRNVVEQENLDYVINFLGDAFIMNKINNEVVVSVIEKLMTHGVDYCSLIPQSKKKCNYDYKNIREQDIYLHGFISFLASKSFVMDEFQNGTTDFDFELKYLKMANKAKTNNIFFNHCILTKNMFYIIPGIEKGKWNRKAKRLLTTKYTDITIPNRGSVGYIESYRCFLIKHLHKFVKPKHRRRIKKFLNKYFKINFATKY